MPVTSYSRTPASNNSAPPAGAPEGMAPSAVNNVIRQNMTDTANEATYNGCKVLGSVSGTNTVIGVLSPVITTYSAGMIVVFTPANTNTGATTLNISGVGALDILKEQGIALTGGELKAGVPAVLVLDSGSDDWILLNSSHSGSFTGTLTGYASGPTGTVNYAVSPNNICTLSAGGEIAGTSNAATLTMTGVPAAIRPTVTREVPSVGLRNNSLNNSEIGTASVGTGGTITFKLFSVSTGLLSASGFEATGGKGLTANWTISYPL